jgi:hypothetical protein
VIYVGRVDLGAAWSQKAAGGWEYLSVKLDDPSLSATISGNLYADEAGETYSLIWSRPKPLKAARRQSGALLLFGGAKPVQAARPGRISRTTPDSKRAAP